MLTENILNDDIVINGFSRDPFRADKAPGVRNGGVCLYYNDHIPIKQRTDLQKLPETIVAEIKLGRKMIFLVVSYQHPSMSNDEVILYMNSLAETYEAISLENPYITVMW